MIDLDSIRVLAMFATLLAVAAFVVSEERRRKLVNWAEAPGAIAVLGLGWAVVATIEYWSAGSLSFINYGDEGVQSFPFYHFVAKHSSGARYEPGIGGGVDMLSVLSSGNQFIDPLRELYRALPIWAATGVHKAGGIAIAFFSAFLLARQAGGASRFYSAVIAAIYTLSFQYNITITLVHGWGHHLMPLGLLVLCWRVEKPRFWLEAIAITLLISTNLTPVQGGLPFYSAAMVGALASGAWRRTRFWGALAMLVVCHALNWVDVLYATKTMAEISSRTYYFAHLAKTSLATILTFLLPVFLTGVPLTTMGASIGALALEREEWGKGLFMTAAPIGLTFFLSAIPFEDFGLGFLNGVNFSYILFSLSPLMVVVVAKAARCLERPLPAGAMAPAWLRSGLLALLIGVPAMLVVNYKVLNLAFWLAVGGQGRLTQVPNLLQPTWLSGLDPVRATTVPFGFEDNNLQTYGIDTIGLSYQLYDWRKPLFWRAVAGSVRNFAFLGLIGVRASTACEPLEARELGDLSLLRVANTRFLLSYLPVNGLPQVDGPETAGDEACAGGRLAKFRTYLRERLNPPPIRVYDLGKPLPRIFLARSFGVAAAGPSSPDFWHLVKKIAPERGAVIEPGPDASLLGDASRWGGARLVRWSFGQDRIEAEVDAPGGAFLVLNMSYLPYWKAKSAEGKPLPVIPVNGIHMAVVVPAGDQRVVLTYERPIPSDLLRRLVARQPEG